MYSIYFAMYIFRFSVKEMKRIYRGFKTECPTGLITEEVFQGIYSRFFPHGGKYPFYYFGLWYLINIYDTYIVYESIEKYSGT